MSQSANQGVRTTIASVAGAVADAVREAHMEHRVSLGRIVASQLEPGEQLLDFEDGRRYAPFVLRIIPFIGDVFFRTQYFILAITDRRLVIAQLSNTFFRRQRDFQQVIASIPLAEIEHVEPSRGMLTSSLTVATRSGKRLHFTDMLKSASERFADEVERAVQSAGSSAGATTPPSFIRPASGRKALRVCIGILGALLSVVSLSGFVAGDFGAAFIMLSIGIGVLAAAWQPWRRYGEQSGGGSSSSRR